MNLKNYHDLIKELFQKVERLENLMKKFENDQKPYAMPEHIMCPIEFRVIGDAGKPDPGDDYRLLDDDEPTQKGDDFYSPFHEKWLEVGKNFGITGKMRGYIRRKIEQPQPAYKYIESTKDIVPWQFYKHGDCLCKIFKDADGEGVYDLKYINDDGTVEVSSDYNFDNDIVRFFRIAEIHEIPDHCLIGSRVRAWNEGRSGKTTIRTAEYYGIVVEVDRIVGNAQPFHVYIVSEGERRKFSHIELINPRGE